MDIGSYRYGKYYSRIGPVLANPEVKTYFGITLFLLTTAFFILFAIRPTLNTITSLSRQIEDGKYTDQKLQEKINALSTAQIEYNRVAPDLPLINAAIPENPAVIRFVKLIEAVAGSADVDIVSLQFAPVDIFNKEAVATDSAIPSSSTIQEHTYSLVFAGSYKNLVAFQEYIRKVQRITTVEKFSINKISIEDRGVQLSLNMSGKIYSLK